MAKRYHLDNNYTGDATPRDAAHDDTMLQMLVRLPQSSEFIIHFIRIGDQAAA